MLAIGVLTLFCNAAWAQQVTGKIIDEGGQPLPGVNIIIEGTSNGTTSDASGGFALDAPSDGVLLFSFIGYKTERVQIQGRTTIDLTLVPDVQTLGEIVVVGYGTQKKVTMTAAVATISSEDVISRQAPNTISLLQGRTPGLQITQNSALPGDESNQIRIRGQGTFSTAGSNPLILIDGVEGRLDLLNPNMIEDISVLKDAASAAIYGSRAANGVILVTTKKGKDGKLNIDYNYNYSMQNPSIKIDRVTDAVEYMELMNKAIAHSGRQPQWTYSPAEIEAYRQGAIDNPDQYPSYDWTDALIRKAPIQKHFLSMNGGKNGTTFNVGFGVLDDTGLLLGTDYTRYDAQVNIKNTIGTRVTFGTDISLAKGKRHDTALTTGSTGPDLIDSNGSEDQMLSAYAAPPLTRPVLADGSGRFTAYAFPNRGGNKNPIAIATDGGGKEFLNNYILFTPYVSVKLIDGLTADVKGAFKFEEEMAKALVVSSYGYTWFPDANGVHTQASVWNGGANSLAQRNTRENQYTLFSTLKYNKTIAKAHTFNALLGHQVESYRYDRLDAYRTKLPSKELWELAAGPAASQTTGSNAYEWAIVSFFGRLNYDFKGKYLLEASFRDDASSRFPKDNRWALFPSVSGGWRVSEESFLTKARWLDELKLRASWGQLGNQNIGNYPYQDALAIGSIGTGSTEEFLDYNFAGTVQQGISKRALNNANIKWETTTVVDIGLDFALFAGKLYGSADWYKKRTTDILRSLQVPDHIGLRAPTINDGIMENMGWEFIVGHRNKIGSFNYSINGNLESYTNKLVRFGAREISGVNLREEGRPYNQYYVLIQDGIYQNQDEISSGPLTSYTSIAPKPGDLRYTDISGPNGVPDGRIDLTYDRVPVEGLFPKFNYGFNLTASYKSFDLSVFAQGVSGRKTYVTGWGVSPFNQASAPPSWWATDAWDGEGSSNSIPHIYVDSGYTPNSQNSTFWLGNSSYIRLKNVQLGYSLPSALLSKIKLQQFRVYVSGDNLVTFTKFFQGLDPERTATSSARAAIYPQATIYSAGVRVTF